jgi:hypothetical protein
MGNGFQVGRRTGLGQDGGDQPYGAAARLHEARSVVAAQMGRRPPARQSFSPPWESEHGLRPERSMGVIEVFIGLGLIAVAVISVNALAALPIRDNISACIINHGTRQAWQKIEAIERDEHPNPLSGAAVGKAPKEAKNPVADL